MKVRDAVMDRHCAAAGDYLEQINNARMGLEQERSAGLRRMQAKGWNYYKARGVEYSLVPGDVKCRVRLAKDGGDAVAESADVDDAGNPEPHDLGEQDFGEHGDDELSLD